MGLIRCLVLGIEVCQRRLEASTEAVLAVQCNCPLNRLIADYISVREVLGYDASMRFVFLRNLVALFLLADSWRVARWVGARLNLDEVGS